jgi:hypothetical protein
MPREEGMDAESAPGWMISPQLEDAVREVPVDPIGAVVKTPGLVPEALYGFLSVVSAPVAERPLRDAEELTDLRSPDPLLEVLLDGV